MERLTGGGVVNVANVIYDQMQLTNAKANVTFDKGLIRMSPVNAGLYGGNLGGTIVIDTRPTPSTYTVNTKLTGVDANKLLSSMSNLKQTLFGVLAANADTHFTGSANGSSADTARTLNGKLSLNLQNGKLAGIDMLNTLASIGKFMNLTKQAEPFTNIAKLTGDFLVHNGVAHTDNLLAAIDGGTLGAKGDVDLANQTINMAATAVLSQQMAQKVGGTGIGGYLSTALANSKGELVMPVLITGSLTSPKVQPDMETIAKMKLENVTSPGGLSGILGAITGKKDQQQPANQQQGQQQPQQQQQAPANPVQGILDALSGKKKQQQPAQQPAQQQPQQQPPPQEDKLPDPSQPK
jgi:AsmA protein